ncbi:hypothetical protein P692DRAFT_20876778, partial [Suillus brevipes Sb2]
TSPFFLLPLPHNEDTISTSNISVSGFCPPPIQISAPVLLIAAPYMTYITAHPRALTHLDAIVNQAGSEAVESPTKLLPVREEASSESTTDFPQSPTLPSVAPLKFLSALRTLQPLHIHLLHLPMTRKPQWCLQHTSTRTHTTSIYPSSQLSPELPMFRLRTPSPLYQAVISDDNTDDESDNGTSMRVHCYSNLFQCCT